MDTIKIRPIKESDTDKIIKWRNNPNVYRNFIYQKKLTRKEHLEWLNTQIKTKKVFQFIITSILDSKDIGSIYLRNVDNKNKKAEFGIFIGDDSSRGKGFGSISTKKILEFAFKKLRLNKVFLRVLADNHQAISSYKKNNFKIEGRFKEDVIIKGKKKDIIFMALLKKEWEKI